MKIFPLYLLFLFAILISLNSYCSDNLLLTTAKSSCPPIENSKYNISNSSYNSSYSTKLDNWINQAIQGKNIFAILIVLFIAGFLTSLSPCVYPLIPITLSIMGARTTKSKWHSFTLAFTYVGAMVLLYTLLGVIFASAGIIMGSIFQSPIFNVTLAIFFILLSFNMLGLFEIVLPQKLQQKLNKIGDSGYKGAFLMGLVAGIIAAPCTGPVLTFILTLIAGQQHIVKGAIYMFTYAWGMGAIFLALGTFSSLINKIPSSGNWMNVVKIIFSIMLLFASWYYLQYSFDVISNFYQQAAALIGNTFIVFILSGILLYYINTNRNSSNKYVKIIRNMTSCLLISMGLFLWFIQTTTAGESKLQEIGKSEQNIKWHYFNHENGNIEDFKLLLQNASDKCMPVIIDFSAKWCVACKELDIHTFNNSKVRNILQHFTAIKIDSTKNSDTLLKIQKYFNVKGLPTIIFIGRNGKLLDNPKIYGFMLPDEIIPALKQVLVN